MNMANIREKIENMVNETYGENAKYILNSQDVVSEIEVVERFEEKGNEEMVEFCKEEALRKAKYFHENRFTPVTVKVGDGATVHLYSDSHACTVIKVTKSTITVQRDKAILDPNFKPEFVAGGFAGHCVNQDDQTYTYERNPEGEIEVYRWSNKYNRYQGGGDGSIVVTKGRREFHDYNF